MLTTAALAFLSFLTKGTNFFLEPKDVGTARAAICGPKVAELNGNVNVVASTAAELTEELVGSHNFVIFTKGSRAEMIRWNTFCRSRLVL